MKGRFLLDVVVGESSAVFQLLTSEDESLLIWRNSLLVLDLGLDVLNAVTWFDIKGDGLTSESLDEDLHTTSETKHQVESRLLLDVVVGKGSAIFKLLTSEDESLLIWRDTLLVLDLGLDVLNRIAWLNIKSDGLSSEGLDEDLHTTSESEDKVESRLLLDVVVGKGSAVFELLTSKDKSLLIWRDSLLVLDLSLDVFDAVAWFDVECDGFSCECLYEDLHLYFLNN